MVGMQSALIQPHRSCRVLVAQIGRRRNYIVPLAILQEGFRLTFCTDLFASAQGYWPISVLWAKLAARFDRRCVDLASADLRMQPLFGFLYASSLRLLKSQVHKDFTFHFCSHYFAGRVAKFVGTNCFDVVYAYNSAALEIFSEASQSVRILDQTSLPAAENSFQPSPSRRNRRRSLISYGFSPRQESSRALRERQEWDLADVILCPSENVVDALKVRGVSAAKLALLPHPIVQRAIPKEFQLNNCCCDAGASLKVIVVGRVSIEKGFRRICGVAAALRDEVSFIWLGAPLVSRSELTGAPSNIRFLGQLTAAEVAVKMRSSDLLLHLSLAEGSANVIAEALSLGLPVICSRESGRNISSAGCGLVVDGDDTALIARCLRDLRAQPHILSSWRTAIPAYILTHGFEAYKSQLRNIVWRAVQNKRHLASSTFTRAGFG